MAELVDADPGAGGGAITGHLDAADPMPSIPATLDPPSPSGQVYPLDFRRLDMTLRERTDGSNGIAVRRDRVVIRVVSPTPLNDP